MRTVWQDVRYGLRTLRRTPGFTTAAILTLALGIGVNVAIFSVVHTVLLRPLPFKDPEQLVWLRLRDPQKNYSRLLWSQLFLEYQKRSSAYADLAALSGTSLEITGGEFPELIRGYQASPNLFTLIDAAPLLGRTFLPEEGKAGQEQVVVLGYGLWQRRFGGDPNLIGKSITLNNLPHAVVGIMPPDFSFFSFAQFFSFDKPVELWQAWAPEANLDRSVYVIGRLRAQVSRRQAQAEALVLSRQFQQQDPELGGLIIQVMPLRDLYVEGFVQFLRRDTQRSLLALLGAAGFVLLIACANIANLLVVRATTRQREMSVRTALGAHRWRLVRQLLTESVLLAVLGAALGLLMIPLGVGALKQLVPAELPGPREIGVDAWMLGLSLLLSVVTGIAFGLIPAWQAVRPNLTEGLKETGQQTTGRAGTNLFRTLLVTCEVALTFVLLTGAGLMIQSVVRLSYVDLGFDPHNLMCVEINLPAARYGGSSAEGPARRADLCQRVTERIRALPGVVSATAAFGLGNGSATYTVEDHPESVGLGMIGYSAGADDWVRAMRIPLLQGRYLADGTHGEPDTIVISETIARTLWPNQSSLGKHILPYKGPWLTVVGVAKDTRLFSYDQDAGRTFYQLAESASLPVPDQIQIVVRTAGDPRAMTKAIRLEVRSVDPMLPVRDFWTFETRLAKTGAKRKLNMVLLSVFASMAVLLCIVGIYGVTSYSAVQRTREMGLRMALGADRTSVLKLAMKRGLTPLSVGLLIGLAGAFALTRVLRSLLYGVTPTDPMTFVAVCLLFLMVGLTACYIPARRASRVDPMATLRYE